MSADTRRNGGEHHESAEILLQYDDETDLWVAEDVPTGVASQGDTPEAALANLDEALAGVAGDGEEPTDDELEALGIDPAANTSSAPSESDPFDV